MSTQVVRPAESRLLRARAAAQPTFRTGEISKKLRAALRHKRAVDASLATAALAVLVPVMTLIALGVWLGSPGPALYCGWRAGKNGSPFRCYKFRTMVQGANEQKEELLSQNQRKGPCFKLVGDPRITRFGQWLRRYSLDELPQLWNVVRGEMSLVGPRPHPLDDVARYEPADLGRLAVTPGITGLWQVEARQDPSFAKNMALDLAYIEHWTLGMELTIVRRTLRAVVSGTGA